MRFPVGLLLLATWSAAPALAQTAPPAHLPAEAAPADETRADETPEDFLWRRSDEAFHAGDYARAVQLHRAIAVLDPLDVENYSVGAWLLWSQGQATAAARFVADGLKSNPENPAMWDAAAQHYEQQKWFIEAENAYAKAVELSGKSADQMLRRRYAHAAQHAGDGAKSIEIWRGLVADFPAEIVNRNNLARVEREQARQHPAPGASAPIVGAGALALSGAALLGQRAKSRQHARQNEAKLTPFG